MKTATWMGSLALVLALPTSAGSVSQISDCHAGNMPKSVYQACVKHQGVIALNSGPVRSLGEPNQEVADNTPSSADDPAEGEDDTSSQPSPPEGMQEREHRSASDAESGNQYAGPADGMPDADGPYGPPRGDDPRWDGPESNGFDEDRPPDFPSPEGENWSGRNMNPDAGGPPDEGEDQ